MKAAQKSDGQNGQLTASRRNAFRTSRSPHVERREPVGHRVVHEYDQRHRLCSGKVDTHIRRRQEPPDHQHVGVLQVGGHNNEQQCGRLQPEAKLVLVRPLQPSSPAPVGRRDGQRGHCQQEQERTQHVGRMIAIAIHA